MTSGRNKSTNSLCIILACLFVLFQVCIPAQAQYRANYSRPAARRPTGRAAGRAAPAVTAGVYPQFRLGNGKVMHWIPEQMPMKVYISRGLCLDEFIDQSLGVSRTNVGNSNDWPNIIIDLLQTPEKIQTLPIAQNYSEQQYQAAVQGILSWKALEKEGIFRYELTDNPEEADIYVFWVHHFVNKMGLALFANDIRGKTAQYLLPVATVRQYIQTDPSMVARSRKPIVTLLRTSESDGTQMPFAKMKASAAHEFGHALGIDGHSANAADLMSPYYGRGVISGNDAATVRYLYRLAPDYMP